MSEHRSTVKQPALRTLLNGQPTVLRSWVQGGERLPMALCLGAVLLGSSLYGAAMGSWRSPLQGVFVALKFPLILLLTAGSNALLNSMLAPLLGLHLSFRESLKAILMSFAITGAVLGAFSPLAAFVTWNSPSMSPDLTISGGTYSCIMLVHVCAIALAGAAGTLRLGQLLRAISPAPSVARRVLLAWLAANLLFGSQLSWILRPFIGSPIMPVEFIRATAFKGNFYETVFASLKKVLQID